ncbi:hypothetical protein DF3PB_20021 [uncultured Defluviicoccus sp.]|mgnify:CR=1 FL=1|uniref:Hemerythrin-like domain-containing protein n=1 Tax=metagenome TaxID=256318 RepID=A0A380TBG5_9ZZZZ|nr:hypothetical protein DF3PB_20021 [uncultured Defluviicoccus sp.]
MVPQVAGRSGGRADVSNLYRLKRQHAEIRKVMAGALLTLEGNTAAASKASELASQLEEIADLVTSHLRIEDREIYPFLLQSRNADVSRAADLLRGQMGGLAQDFEAFARKYAYPGSITAGGAAFCEEARATFAKLRDRMQREERELYPLMARALHPPGRVHAGHDT